MKVLFVTRYLIGQEERFATTLRQLGAEVCILHEVEPALDVLGKNPPDLVVSGYIFSGGDDARPLIAACERMKIPIFIYTGTPELLQQDGISASVLDKFSVLPEAAAARVLSRFRQS